MEKAVLIEKLKENLKLHNEIVAAAIEGFWKTVREGFDEDSLMIHIREDYPKDYSEHYEDTISMLELSKETEIVLDERDFKRLVLNKWEWAQEFVAANSFYTDTASKFTK